MKIKAHNINKVYDSANGKITALENFSLEVKDGEFVCLVGPSGCGKSTFLRILAGLEPASSGSIEIAQTPNSTKPVNNVVFQEYAIFPWKTVINNVSFGLQMRGIAKKQRMEIASSWLERVGLSKFANYYPAQLSGGMKQRVSIARALANDPEVLLMDEPLGALDAQTRTVLQVELLRIWEEHRKTVVYITHSIEEAILLGDRVIIMTAQPGRLKKSFEIDIPRPRDIEVTATPEFAKLSGIIWQALKDEVKKAYDAQILDKVS
ncbi:MAG TPA: ABC transporter ATP-binding protein [Trueperaceae bacterium]|nr:ABC transporter ATP-binding protein [Trueperaceae bacterium]